MFQKDSPCDWAGCAESWGHWENSRLIQIFKQKRERQAQTSPKEEKSTSYRCTPYPLSVEPSSQESRLSCPQGRVTALGSEVCRLAWWSSPHLSLLSFTCSQAHSFMDFFPPLYSFQHGSCTAFSRMLLNSSVIPAGVPPALASEAVHQDQLCLGSATRQALEPTCGLEPSLTPWQPDCSLLPPHAWISAPRRWILWLLSLFSPELSLQGTGWVQRKLVEVANPAVQEVLNYLPQTSGFPSLMHLSPRETGSMKEQSFQLDQGVLLSWAPESPRIWGVQAQGAIWGASDSPWGSQPLGSQRRF